MSLGSGVGSGYGGPQEPTIEQRVATASVEVSKQMMGIVHDTLTISFTKLGGDIWHYKSDMGHPVLHPMNTLRVDSSGEESVSPSVQEAFDELVKTLPPAMQTRLAADMQRSGRPRNPAMLALEETLYGAAKAMATINDAMRPDSPESAAAARFAKYQQFLPYAMAAYSKNSGEIATGSQNFLEELGANEPHFDQFFAASAELGKWSALLKGSITGEIPKEELAKSWTGLQQSIAAFDRLPKGASMQLIGQSLQAMQPLAAAAMADIKAPGLLLALWMATVGINKEEGPAGFSNNALSQMSSSLAHILLPTLAEGKGNPGQELFLNLIIKSGSFLAAAGGRLFMDAELPKGLGMLDQPQYRPLACDFAMTMISSSQIMEAFFGQAMAAIKAEEEANRLASKALAQNTKMIMLLGMKKKGGAASGGLLSFFQGQMAAMESMLEMAQERGSISNDKSAGFARVLSQARLALGEGDSEPFFQAWSDLLDQLGGNPKAVEEDCRFSGDAAVQCHTLFSQRAAGEKQFQTTLVQPA